MSPVKKIARQAGLLYLIVGIFGGFAHFGVRIQFIDYKNAQTTVKNITANEFLFRFGFAADIIQLVAFTLLILILYDLFKAINGKIAKIMFTLAILGVPIAGLNMLNQFAVLVIVDNPELLSTFNSHQLSALVLMFLNLHNIGYAIAHVFFGLWLFPLGYLVYKSNGMVPKTIGFLLMLATFGYLMHMFSGFLYPVIEHITSYGALFSGLVEMSFCLWLLIKGVKYNTHMT